MEVAFNAAKNESRSSILISTLDGARSPVDPELLADRAGSKSDAAVKSRQRCAVGSAGIGREYFEIEMFLLRRA